MRDLAVRFGAGIAAAPGGVRIRTARSRTLFVTYSITKSVSTALTVLAVPAANAPPGQKPGGAVVSGACTSRDLGVGYGRPPG